MPYSDPAFEARRNQLRGGGGTAPSSPSTRGFSDSTFESRRVQVKAQPFKATPRREESRISEPSRKTSLISPIPERDIIVQPKKTFVEKAKETIKGINLKKIGQWFSAGAKTVPSQFKQATGLVAESFVKKQQAVNNFYSVAKFFGLKDKGISPLRGLLGVTAGTQVKPELVKKTAKKTKELRETGAREQRETLERELKDVAPSKGLQGFLEQVAFNFPQMAASTGLTMATAIITKNPALATTVGLSTSYGLGASEVYSEARGHGLSDQEALPLSMAGGVIIGALDFIPLERVIRKSGAIEPIKKSLIKRIASQIVSTGIQSGFEGITEAAQEIVGGALARTYNENRDVFEGVEMAALIGAFMGGVTDVSVAGVVGLTGKKATVEQTTADIEKKINKVLTGKDSIEKTTLLNSLITQDLTPDQAIAFVIDRNMGKTDIGKKINLLALQAKEQDQNISINLSEDGKSIDVEVIDKTLPEVIEKEIKKEKKKEVSPTPLSKKEVKPTEVKEIEPKVGEDMEIPQKYKTAYEKIKQFQSNFKIEMIESIPFDKITKGKQKSMGITFSKGGTLDFDIRPDQIVIWSASNRDKNMKPIPGQGEVTKAIRALMALAKEENKNVMIYGATDDGYWQHLGFNTKDYIHPVLTPKELAKIDRLKKIYKKPVVEKPKPQPKKKKVKKPREFKLTAPEIKKLPSSKKVQLIGTSEFSGFKQDTIKRIEEGRISSGDLDRAGIKLKGTDIKTLIQYSPELKANPVLIVKKTKEGMRLTFEGKTQKLSLVPEALGIKKELKEGDIVNLRGFEKRGQVPVLKGVPGGYGDPGGYADSGSIEKAVNGIKSVEMPELVRIAREAMGSVPTLKKFKKSLGMFYGINNGVIKLNPTVFENPEVAAKVMAHEIGHMADYLDDKTLARGNLVGRIASLNKNMKHRFDKLNDPVIRKELKELSQKWKPFDENANKNFTKYRHSSKELYADAISVLLNDPVFLQQEAPKFWKGFFDYLNKKPSVEKNLRNIWNLLNQGEEAVFRARDKELDRAFKKGEDAYTSKYTEREKRKTSLLYQTQVLFDDKNTPIIKKLRQAQKAGKTVLPQDNPEFALHGLSYTDGKLKNYVNDKFQPAFQEAQKVNDGWETLGKKLLLERVIHERGELANPQGFNPKTAQKQLEMMEANMGERELKVLIKAEAMYRLAVKESVDYAEKHGFYTPELIKQMKMNPAYATYQVIDYLDTYISARVYKSVGTLKDVANPATATTMKLISVRKAIERNNVKKLSIEFMQNSFPEEIEAAKTKWNGKNMSIRDPSDPNTGLVITIEDGQPQGWYMSKDIADTLNYNSNKTINAMARVSRAISQSRFYRPLFTSFNLGFQTFNFVRDFTRYWKNVPDQNIGQAITSFPRAIARYAQAAPHAAKRALKLKDNLIREMEDSKILGLTYNDMFRKGVDEHQKQIERVLEKSGVIENKRRNKLFTPFHWVLDSVETIGNFIETLPKVAGYIELKGKMPEAQLAEFVRTSVGSPDFRIGGTATPVTNNIFLFSNAIKEGIKSDLKIAFTKNKSRAGFWWKTVASTFLPKVIMAGIAGGLYGEELKKMMDKATEYDKTNYTIVPLGLDENDKAVYLRVPQDETGRFLGGLLWKILRLNKDKKTVQDVFDIFSFGAGQFPTFSPSFTGAGALVTYLSGKNPYDSFRNRNIIPNKEFKAGPEHSFPILLKWLGKNQGLGIFYPTNQNYYNEKETELQKTLNKPFISNILGRWVKVSSYGEREKLRKTTKKVEKERAVRQIEESKKLEDAVKKYRKGSGGIERRNEIEKQLIKDVVGESPYRKDRKTKATNTRKKFRVSILRGESDERVNAVISATTNDEKLTLLEEIKQDMEQEAFVTLLRKLHEHKAISLKLGKKAKKL